MHIVKISDWIIQINVDETESFYKNEEYMSCVCDNCKNFLLCCDILPVEIRNLFDELYIEPKKEGEVVAGFENEEDTYSYYLFYHLSGKIISLEEFEFIKQYKDVTVTELDIPNDYGISFTEKISLLSKNFPTPAVEFKIFLKLPWLLKN